MVLYIECTDLFVVMMLCQYGYVNKNKKRVKLKIKCFLSSTA